MTRVEEDPDVPPHYRRPGPKRWRVEVKWRTLGRRPERWTTVGGGKYQRERDARQSYTRALKGRWYLRVRLLDPEGNIIAEADAAGRAAEERRA